MVTALEQRLGTEVFAAAPSAEQMARLPGVLQSLAVLLRDDNTAALDVLEQNAAMLQFALGNDYHTMERNMRNFDFDEALEAMTATARRMDIAL
jgi:hypothetical protein